MSTTTQTQAIQSFRARVNEPIERRFRDIDIRRWINEGVREIARRTESNRTEVTVSASVGVSSYSLAALSLVRIHKVSYVSADGTRRGDMRFIDEHSFDVRGTTVESTPKIWTTGGFTPSLTLKVYPAPSDAGDFEVTYYAFPADLETENGDDANTALAIPDGWGDVVVDYVEYKARLSDGDQRWQHNLQMFEQNIDRLAGASERFTDQNGQWGEDPAFGGLGWLHGYDGYDYW